MIFEDFDCDHEFKINMHYDIEGINPPEVYYRCSCSVVVDEDTYDELYADKRFKDDE